MYFYKSNYFNNKAFKNLNSSLFIAKRIIKAGKNSQKNAQTIIKIATVSTILSTAVMILTIFISDGFKSNIIEKVKGFGSDIQVTNYDANRSFEYLPITLDSAKLNKIQAVKDVQSVKSFITKPAIIKYQNQNEGTVLKAFSQTEDYAFFQKQIVKGRFPDFKNKEILISETLAKKLNIHIGDKVLFYFIQEPIRYRKLTVSGFYSTDIYEIDLLFVMADYKMLQKLNGWDETQCSGYEINSSHDEAFSEVQQILQPTFFNENEDVNLKVADSKERFPQFYLGFDLFNTNVLIIISLMIAVAAINLISALLIIIIENKNIVGLMKSFGATNGSIRNIFTYIAFQLVVKGLIWGNVLSLIIASVQYYFRVIPLPPKHYYTSFVPIGFDWWGLITLNVATIVLINLFLLFPASYISRISPVKVIKFN